MVANGGNSRIVFSMADDIYWVTDEGGAYQKLNRTNSSDPLSAPMGVAVLKV